MISIKNSHIAVIRKKLNRILAKGDEAVLAAAIREKTNTILTDDDGLGRMAYALDFEVKATPDLLMEGLKRGIIDVDDFESFVRELIVENRLSSVVAELYVMEGKKYVKSQRTNKDERASR